MAWPTRGKGDPDRLVPADVDTEDIRKTAVIEESSALVGESSAVLDSSHVGDIKGAFGTIKQHDTGARRSWTGRMLTLLAIMGPGLIVMVGDNDAGGVSTYAQAGQNYRLSLLWTLVLLIPVL